jgi:uncharacterized protein
MFAPEMSLSPQTTSAEEFFDLAMRYCLGRGVSQDNVSAHKWFNIAALKGNKAAVAEALRQARAFLTVH